jgi:transposase
VDKAAESAQHLARELQKDSETSQSSDSTRVGHASNAADVHDRRKSESSARTASRTDHVIVRIEVQDQGVG